MTARIVLSLANRLYDFSEGRYLPLNASPPCEGIMQPYHGIHCKSSVPPKWPDYSDETIQPRSGCRNREGGDYNEATCSQRVRRLVLSWPSKMT